MKNFFSIILFLLVSCRPMGNDEKGNIDHDFEEFLKSTPVLDLPIEMWCGIERLGQVKQPERFRRYLPTNYADPAFGVLGYKRTDKDQIVIIYGYRGDDVYPILYSYDLHGSKIDSLSLILNPCGGADQYQIPSSHVYLDHDLTITLIDTTKLIHYPSDTSDYVLDSTRITRKVMIVTEGGLIKPK